MKCSGTILSCVLVLYITTITTVTTQNIALIKDYLNYNHIKTTLIVTCESINEILKILTELHTIDSYVNVLSIRSESAITALNYTQFFLRSEGPHTVVIDLECVHVASILKQSSQKMLFHLERTWLIFGQNLSQSYDLLSQENINMDADVTLVIPLENRWIEIPTF